jgi:hypothetical protein
MKVVKTLVLTLVLAGGAFAGEMPQWDPAAPPPPAAPASRQATNNAMAKILVAIIQSLAPMR